MAYPPKIEQALKVMDAAGVPRRQAAPWSYRLLWRLGIAIRPPQFHGRSATIAIVLCIYAFGYPIAFPLAHWLIAGSEKINAASFIGGWIGTFIVSWIAAAVAVHQATKYKLPSWDEIDDIAARFD